MSLPALADLRRGPKYATPRNRARPTRGPILAKVGKMLGWSFFPWQTDAADVAMEFDPATKLPYFRTVGISVARQNGKTTLVLSRVATQLIIPRSTVAYTAQDRGLARIKWAEHVDLLMETPFAEKVAVVETTNHREMLVMRNGSRYMPVTPSKKAGKSLSLDLAIIDEAWAHESHELVGALQGTMMARPMAQIWMLSNAGFAESALWMHYTKVGRLEATNPASSMCWVEYCADDDVDVYDRQGWVDANPSLDLPGGVSSLAMHDAALADEEVFRRENLNLWPQSTGRTVIDPVGWAAAARETELGDQVALSLDFTPERDRGTLTAAGLLDDGQTVLEVIDATSDIEALVARTIANAKAFDTFVVIDSSSPARSTIPRLEKEGIKVRMIPATEMAAACGDFHDAVVAGRLIHQGDYRITDAISSAGKRAVGKQYEWKPRGGADITPLRTATMARWGVVTAPAKRTSAYADDDADVTVA